MGDSVKLRASDGHQLDAYLAMPEGEPVAGLVVVQEIFGVNAHIRRVADGYAQDGFLAVAPALFDRIERKVELGYEGADAAKARSLVTKFNFEKALWDVEAAMKYAAASASKKVAVIGYCLGGSVAWLAAARLHPAAALGYYGGQIAKFAVEGLNCPVMLHFGREDAHIPPTDVEKVKGEHPEVEIYWYNAGHGFNCDARSSYNPEAAKIARERSLDFLKKWTEEKQTGR